MRYPELEFINIELWYIDLGEKLEKQFSRERAMKFLERYTKRGMEITGCTDFPPNPSVYNCRFCPHKQTGNCEWAQ